MPVERCQPIDYRQLAFEKMRAAGATPRSLLRGKEFRDLVISVLERRLHEKQLAEWLPQKKAIAEALSIMAIRLDRRRDRAQSDAARKTEPGRIVSLQANRLERLLAPQCLEVDTPTAEQVGVKICRRGKNWEVKATAGPTRYSNSPGETIWKNGRASGYIRAENITYVHSIVRITEPRTRRDIAWEIGTRTGTYRLARGYRWDIDGNGLRLVSRAGDYHPTASDLIHAQPGSLESILKKNAETRKKAVKKAKQELAVIRKSEREGASICLRDSLAAGNCLAGSTSWATQHGLDPRGHVAPSRLLAMANGDTQRVAIVVANGLRRHRREMERGYCDVADHRVGGRDQ